MQHVIFKQKQNSVQEKILARVIDINKNGQRADMSPPTAQNVVERLESVVPIKNVRKKLSEHMCTKEYFSKSKNKILLFLFLFCLFVYVQS